MTNPTYRCPHCHKPVELELSKSGQLTLKTATPRKKDNGGKVIQ